MALIRATDLTFTYEGSPEPVLEGVSFQIDTSWKLGLIGRNGKGKTTLLNLLMGKYPFQGSLTMGTTCDYFPYELSADDLKRNAADLTGDWKPSVQLWQVLIQLAEIGMDEECLYRPFETLSHGERTRLMLAVLFSEEGEFLLIDEPTNHLDRQARESVKAYLRKKSGFILVSHDRDLLDAVTDHVLVFNRATVEVQAGNFTSWWENKQKKDAYAKAENEKHLKEIGKLKSAADRSGRWAEKNENTKIGFDPVKENDRSISTRSYIGAKTKKMQARVKSYQKRIEREIQAKEDLLQDLEDVADLKICPLKHHKEVLVNASHLSLGYGDGRKGTETGAETGVLHELFQDLSFRICQGDRLVLQGRNGCGKSSIIKAILQKAGYADRGYSPEGLLVSGTLDTASGMVISCVSQDTSFLSGSLREYSRAAGLNESLFFAVLRQLDLESTQFTKNMEDFSEGQKKKVLIAASLVTPAHLYIWDEPLNYIDVFSRMQIEELILRFRPTMLVVEHDERFRERIATGSVEICRRAGRSDERDQTPRKGKVRTVEQGIRILALI